MKGILPLFVSGKVVKGFGRGSKSLGIPTANYEPSVVDQLPESLKKGIYYGFAQVDQSQVFDCSLSLGWNPYFGNQVKSMETHVIHNFPDDFYGSILKVCIIGYIRDEMNFTSIDELKSAIHRDIELTRQELAKPEVASVRNHPFFNSTSGETNHVNGSLQNGDSKL